MDSRISCFKSGGKSGLGNRSRGADGRGIMGDTDLMEESKAGREKSAAVNLARQIFLYGNGDGRPITDLSKLAEFSGCHLKTIHKHFRGWEKEREEMLSEPTNGAFGLSVSGDVLRQHRATVDYLANLERELREEVEALPKILSELRTILRSLSNSERYDEGIQAFQIFLKLYGNRRETAKLHLQIQQRLKLHSGIELLEEAAATREKTLASGRAKLDVSKEAKAAELRGSAVPVAGTAADRDDAFADDEDDEDVERSLE